MMRFFLLLCLAIGIPMASYAQFEGSSPRPSQPKAPVKSKKEPFAERLIVGGGLDFQLSSIIAVGVTPLIGYEITESTTGGAILTYRYFENRNVNPTYTTNTYGVAPFLRQYFLENLFVHAEYEFLNGQWYYNQENQWVESFLLGAGYRAYVGDQSFFALYILWNLTEDPAYPIYNNPIIRMNFGIGL